MAIEKIHHNVIVGQRMFRFADCAGTLAAEHGIVSRVTPCGAWVAPSGGGLDEFALLCDFRGRATRKARYYRTPEEAWTSFRARKAKQVKILEWQLARARAALVRANGTAPPPGTYTEIPAHEPHTLL